jgi:hypothetical protein
MRQVRQVRLVRPYDRGYGPQSGAESQVGVRVIGCMSEPSTRAAQTS